jgi:hypothetical protein
VTAIFVTAAPLTVPVALSITQIKPVGCDFTDSEYALPLATVVGRVKDVALAATDAESEPF